MKDLIYYIKYSEINDEFPLSILKNIDPTFDVDQKYDQDMIFWFKSTIKKIHTTKENNLMGELVKEYGASFFLGLFKSGEEVIYLPDRTIHLIKYVEFRDGEMIYILDNDYVVNDTLVVPNKETFTWDDMKKLRYPTKGWYITDDSEIVELDDMNRPLKDDCKNVAADKDTTYMMLASSQISQLINTNTYGGWVPMGKLAYYIEPEDSTFDSFVVSTEPSTLRGGMLRFYKREDAQLFLQYNRKLVSDYLMWGK